MKSNDDILLHAASYRAHFCRRSFETDVERMRKLLLVTLVN